MAGYRLDLERFNLAARLEVCRATSANDVVTSRTGEGTLGVRLGHAWELAPLTLDLGVGLGAGILRQTFTSTGLAPPRTSATGFLEAGLRVLRDLPGGAYVFADVAGRTYFLRQWQMDSPAEPTAIFAISAAVGLGMRWSGR
jgi:hypothetical protein